MLAFFMAGPEEVPELSVLPNWEEFADAGRLKEKVMRGAQTKGFNPLDPIHDERHRLRQDPLARESLAYLFTLPAEGLAAFVYTWVNGESKAGSALCVYGPGVGDEAVLEIADGITVPIEQGFRDWRVGGVHVRLGEPLKTFEITFTGGRAGVECSFEGMHPAYGYASHRNGCPYWMADDRFEQSGLLRGVLRIGKREIPFETMCHRDHSWGIRDWGMSQHWKWIHAAGPGIAVHFWQAHALGRTDLQGYVYRDGKMEVVTAVDVDFEHDSKMLQKSLNVVFHDEAGRSTTLRGAVFSLYPFKVSPLATINEAAMAVDIDGTPGVGFFEMTWAKSYLDYMEERGV